MPRHFTQTPGGGWADAETGEVFHGTPFDAAGKMRKIRTRQGMMDYLDVKYRVAWLRADWPDAQIVTALIEGDAEHARFKCTITLPATGALGTGHGSETQSDFPDFFEKAETKAVGRACASLGYGTEGASDFDDGEPMDGAPAAKDERAARRGAPATAPPAEETRTPAQIIADTKTELIKVAAEKGVKLTLDDGTPMDKVQMADALHLLTQHDVPYTGNPLEVLARFRQIVDRLPAKG